MISLKKIFLLAVIFLTFTTAFLYYRFWFLPYEPHPVLSRVSPTPKIYCVKKDLSIAVLTDIHNSWDKLEQAVQKINAADYDLAVCLGDLTRLGEPNDLNQGKKILDKLKIPYYIVPGNHDIWLAKNAGQPTTAYWQNYFEDKSPACFEQNNFNLILVNNADERRGIDPADWSKIISCLQSDKPGLIFTHIPLYHPANERVMGQYSDAVATQSSQLLELGCRRRLRLVAAGHLHSFAKYFYLCSNGRQLTMVIAGAVTSERNFQSPRFLELKIFNDGTVEEKEIVLN